MAAFIVLVGALPLLMTRPAPLQDWPNHLARLHIIEGLLRHDAFWTRLYSFTGFMVPNAAMDLGLLAMASVGIAPQEAGQLFLLATYLVFVGGFCALSRALGALGPSKPVLAVLLFYNHALFWGLVSYMLAIGLMLGLLGLWLGQPRRPWRRSAIAACGAAALFFTHAVAAFVWPVLLACFDACRPWPIKGLASGQSAARRVGERASCAVALAVAVVLLRACAIGADHERALQYAGRDVSGQILHKLSAFADIVLGGSLAQDASSLLALLICTGLCLVRPQTTQAGMLRAAGLACVALLLLTLAAPERLGTGSQLDARLAILPLVFGAAAVRVRVGRRAVQVMTATVAARTLILALHWQAAGAVFLDFRRLTAPLPSGSLMMMAYGTRLPTLSWQQIWSRPVTSIATQLVFRDLFIPSIFANPAEQPIALRADYSRLRQPWDLTDDAHVRAALPALANLCSTAGFSGVFLTVLYPGGLPAHHAGLRAITSRPDFLVLDACRPG